ncbi:MAG TPA: hypothetical protein VN578_12345 [Candidatus Binatia bacterium]|jgi:hypothetical protein|nr:hypothetical protein [Candidatus Binatia bacterium]
MNQTLQQIHDLLLAQHNALANLLDAQTDPAKAKAILMEMQEVLHRIDLVQNLLFRQSSAQLDQTLAGIKKANDSLAQSLASFGNLVDFVSSTTKFLTAVDQAIDIAKTLAA